VYTLHQGRILTWSLEAHVVDHCNLRCRDCCTLSPQLAERAVDPAALERDLSLAATALAPHLFKLTGGEPLLHPDIVGCVDAVRRSGVSPVVSITTNGHLARRAPEALWSRIDRMTVSWYSSAPLPERTLAHIEDRCRRHDVLLTIKPSTVFQQMDRDGYATPEEARAVWAGCWLKVRCHMVRDGLFTVCTRPPHLAATHGDPALASGGVPLAGPDLRGRILTALQSEAAIPACAVCLGASGPEREHRQDPARR
jgi:hypothetical protein